jgi:hypothetical protein
VSSAKTDLDSSGAAAPSDPAIPGSWRALLEGLAAIIADDILMNLNNMGRGADGPLPGGASGPHRDCLERQDNGGESRRPM